MHDLLPLIPSYLNDVTDSIKYFLPEIYLAGLFIVVLITDLLFGKQSGWIVKFVACAGVLGIILKDLLQISLLLTNGQANGHFLFNEMLLLTRTGINFKFVIDLLAFILLLYFNWDNSLARHRKGLGDLYSIVIASLTGLHLMIMAANLLSIYLSIEMVSIASYLLVAYRSENSSSAEAGLKYVLFGAASSAIMLYGISLLYVFTGSLNLFTGNLLHGLVLVDPLPVSFALVLVLAGIGFKLSFVPMHFWVPDVYEGASTPVTAYLSTLPKIAGFALLVNILPAFIFFPKWNAFDFRLCFSVIGIITMIAGNFAALLQTNVKRMLAYSSIGHTGFALMAIAALSLQGVNALTYYLLVYGIANIGALALASYFTNQTGAEDVNDYKGLGSKYPVASVSFVVILISLTGLPITAGFTGKVFVFSAVYGVYQQNHDIWLLLLMVTGALATVVSLFYYIKIPLYLFIKRNETAHDSFKGSYNLIILSVIISLLLVFLGAFPDLLLRYL
jgi:NADH-quinone oxidoreductase subunit N